MEIIKTESKRKTQKLKVGAYARVSTDKEEQDATDRVAQQTHHRSAAESYSHLSQEITDTASTRSLRDSLSSLYFQLRLLTTS